MTNLQITDDEMLDALSDMLQARPIRQPGWVDAVQLAARNGFDRSTVRVKMADLVRQGKAETAIVWDEQRRANVRVWRMV